MAIGDTAQPTNGIPSLTASELLQLYAKYNITPGPTDLSSDQENAMKYSAAGIERQIALRAGNTPGSGVRGDETLAPLTVPADQSGHVATLGPAAIGPATIYTAPAGLAANSPTLVGLPSASTYLPASVAAVAPTSGIGLPTILIGLVVLGAGFYLWEHR